MVGIRRAMLAAVRVRAVAGDGGCRGGCWGGRGSRGRHGVEGRGGWAVGSCVQGYQQGQEIEGVRLMDGGERGHRASFIS